MKEFKDYFSKSEIVLWSSSVMVIIISFCVFDRINYMTLCASLIGVTSLIFNATGTYRLCADKVVCKRVYEVERILLN